MTIRTLARTARRWALYTTAAVTGLTVGLGGGVLLAGLIAV